MPVFLAAAVCLSLQVRRATTTGALRESSPVGSDLTFASSATAISDRVELHVHLDGSVGLAELVGLCQTRGINLGGRVPATPADLLQYLREQPVWHQFDVVNDIVGGNATVISDVAAAFVAFQAASGVAYTEVRYDPVRLSRSGLLNESISMEETVQAVRRGLAIGAVRHGVAVHQILCAMRGQSPERCFEVARLAAAALAPYSMGGVVGLDLAGDEVEYRNAPYVSCFRFARHALGLRTTLHAGEFDARWVGEVRSAVLEMEVDRVGHGYAAATDEGTMRLLEARGVHLEACPASAKAHGPWAFRAIGAFKAHNLSFGLNTDDPTVFLGNTSAAADEELVRQGLNFTDEDVRRAYAAAFAARFGATEVPVPRVSGRVDRLYV